MPRKAKVNGKKKNTVVPGPKTETVRPRAAEKVPKRKVRKSEMVAEKIREYIIRKKLKSGDSLPTEGELSLRFKVSRVSVREATQALAFLGIIDAAPRRGLSVGDFSMERVSRYVGFHFAISDYPLGDLIDTRVIIEIGGLSYIAKHMAEDPSLYADLNSINEQLRRTEKQKDWIAGDLKFHRRLATATGLDALVAFQDLLQVFFQRFREDFPRSNWKSGVAAHQRIIDALRDNQTELAAAEMTQHIESHRARIPLASN